MDEREGKEKERREGERRMASPQCLLRIYVLKHGLFSGPPSKFIS